MKNNNEKQKKKEQMNMRHKKNALLEFVYNGPYLIAVVITSMMVMICSDQIGVKAIAADARTLMEQTMKVDVMAEELSSDLASENVEDDVQIMENMDINSTDKMENEGECKEEKDEKTNNNIEKEDIEFEKYSENNSEEQKGLTKFEIYEPQEIDSYYYSDAGKVALTTEYPYSIENISYFNDAIFLGDSRTLGISDYAGLDEADFYCDSGMTIFKLLESDGVTCQKTGNKENLTSVLQQNKYGKIYIMLGMNELGYGNTEMYLEQYRKVVNQIREWQPDSIIYIMANLHVSREKNNPETEFNNININDKNAASALLANGTDIFYLDANPLFTDSEGFLNSELSFDGVHLYAQHYDIWREFLLEHAVPSRRTEQNEDADYTVSRSVVDTES